MVEFIIQSETEATKTIRVNPALVSALYQRAGAPATSIVLSDGTFYEVPGTIAEVDDKLTAHYTDIRYVAFVLESLCAHLKVEIVPPSQLKVEVIPPTGQPPEQES